MSSQSQAFYDLRDFLKFRLSKQGARNGTPRKIADICDVERDWLAARVFSEYGSIFATDITVEMPPKCIFVSSAEVTDFQKTLKVEAVTIAGVEIELQHTAAKALAAAVEEAESMDLKITPLDGVIAGRRNYADTLRIWNSRFVPALNYWMSKKKITEAEVASVIKLPLREQISKVVEWESRGYFFSTGFSKSIFNSVAPPGTSQHLSLLAFDVVEAQNPAIRRILNAHGWFQTIKTDEPHFSYLGVAETELPKRGLIRFVRGGLVYWVPSVSKSSPPATNSLLN
ncbi:MAG: hypothetical protein ACJ72Z_11715 [Pyrinomonadaceae bacterium]